jgi:uncharacterized phage infection (PIP) family protein YhgE
VASVSEESSAAAEEVSAATEEMSAQVQEISASAQALAEVAEQLRALTAQFKVAAEEEIAPTRQEQQKGSKAPRPASAGHPQLAVGSQRVEAPIGGDGQEVWRGVKG